MGRLSQRECILQYVLDTYGTEAEYPWADLPDGAVLRHSGSKKWYGLIMSVLPGRLGLPEGGPVDVINVKCGTAMVGSLLSEKGFLPAYHMNKEHWISILLDGSVPNEQIFTLLELSYDSVAPKQRKKQCLNGDGSR